MKKNFKKLLLICGLVLFVSGCSNAIFNNAYNKITNKKGSYNLSIRIIGVNDKTNINETIFIQSYRNSKYLISRTIVNASTDNTNRRLPSSQKTIYVIDGITYTQNATGQYVKTTESVFYNDPSLYLIGFKNAKANAGKILEKIGEVTYDVYNLTFVKKDIENILNNNALTDVKLTKEVTGKVYIDKEGYIFRLIYNIENITINANYSAYNMAKDITLPTN